MNNPLQLVIFDIAGTSVRDNGFVERAFLKVSDRYGLKLDAAWIKPRMGVHKLGVMREAIEASGREIDATPEELSQTFEDAIDAEVNAGAAPAMPGAAELIADLRAANTQVAFTTGFSRTTADTVLRGAGLHGDAVVASNEVERGRPAPDIVLEAMKRVGVSDPQGVAVVGDTPNDLGSGVSARSGLVVGIGHGTHELDELRSHEHTDLVPDIASLRALLARHCDIAEPEPAS